MNCTYGMHCKADVVESRSGAMAAGRYISAFVFTAASQFCEGNDTSINTSCVPMIVFE